MTSFQSKPKASRSGIMPKITAVVDWLRGEPPQRIKDRFAAIEENIAAAAERDRRNVQDGHHRHHR